MPKFDLALRGSKGDEMDNRIWVGIYDPSSDSEEIIKVLDEYCGSELEHAAKIVADTNRQLARSSCHLLVGLFTNIQTPDPT